MENYFQYRQMLNSLHLLETPKMKEASSLLMCKMITHCEPEIFLCIEAIMESGIVPADVLKEFNTKNGNETITEEERNAKLKELLNKIVDVQNNNLTQSHAKESSTE